MRFINIIKPGGIKKQVTEFDDVSYDFNKFILIIVRLLPFERVYNCSLSIENNQRFNISDRQVLKM